MLEFYGDEKQLIGEESVTLVLHMIQLLMQKIKRLILDIVTKVYHINKYLMHTKTISLLLYLEVLLLLYLIPIDVTRGPAATVDLMDFRSCCVLHYSILV